MLGLHSTTDKAQWKMPMCGHTKLGPLILVLMMTPLPTNAGLSLSASASESTLVMLLIEEHFLNAAKLLASLLTVVSISL